MTFSRFFLLSLTLALWACSSSNPMPRHSEIGRPPAKTQPQTQNSFKVGTPYKVAGKRYYPRESYTHVETGIASWYGPQFHGKRTANGEIFDMNELTAAHKTLQLPSLVRVTNLDNGKSLIVRVNDRGPFSKARVLDVSKRAAELLGFKNKGLAKVRLEVLEDESKLIAEMAKRGESTRGTEIVLNKGKPLKDDDTDRAVVKLVSADKAAPVQEEAIARIPGKISDGRFLPAQKVEQRPVPARNDIYVQAGAFSNQNNAIRLQARLSQVGQTVVQPVRLNGREIYRVRLGPFTQVAQADQILNSVVANGFDQAMIVID